MDARSCAGRGSSHCFPERRKQPTTPFFRTGGFRPSFNPGAGTADLVLCKRARLCYTLRARERLFRLFLGSSAVEHSTVNRMVAGSNPARGASRGFYVLRYDRFNLDQRGIIIRRPEPRSLAPSPYRLSFPIQSADPNRPPPCSRRMPAKFGVFSFSARNDSAVAPNLLSGEHDSPGNRRIYI